EVVERYISKRFKLNVDHEAHPIAQKIERSFYADYHKHRSKLCWQRHEKRIARVWRREHRWVLKKRK
ncbi:MAG: hypothetical protein ABIG30_01655, partial [Candidatus Aenigmatarchaeota archaeon]